MFHSQVDPNKLAAIFMDSMINSHPLIQENINTNFEINEMFDSITYGKVIVCLLWSYLKLTYWSCIVRPNNFFKNGTVAKQR